jgi:hypothetical protein
MSIVIGDFEVIHEAGASTGATDTKNVDQPAKNPGVTPEAIAYIEQHLAERALRLWAD